MRIHYTLLYYITPEHSPHDEPPPTLLYTQYHAPSPTSYPPTVFQKGLKLPGSRTDIIRTKTISGPSPVGGSTGGTEGKVVQTLDEFELQAAHYNIACAHARLDQIPESC